MPAARSLLALTLVTIACGLTIYGIWALFSFLWDSSLGLWTIVVLPLVLAAPPLALFWLLDRRRRRRAPPTGS